MKGFRVTTPREVIPVVEMPRLPAWVRGLAVVCSAAAVVSAVAVLVLAVMNSRQGAKLPYDTLGFEVMIVVAGVFGVLTGLGRYRTGPAVALACVAGTVAVGGLLGLLGSDAPYHGLPRLDVKRLAGVSMAPMRDAQLALAALLALCAAGAVFSRRPKDSLRHAAMGVGLGVPVVLIAAGMWAMRSAMGNWPPALQGGVIVFGSLVVLGFLAASVHMVVRAFEVGGQDALKQA